MHILRLPSAGVARPPRRGDSYRKLEQFVSIGSNGSIVSSVGSNQMSVGGAGTGPCAGTSVCTDLVPPGGCPEGQEVYEIRTGSVLLRQCRDCPPEGEVTTRFSQWRHHRCCHVRAPRFGLDHRRKCHSWHEILRLDKFQSPAHHIERIIVRCVAGCAPTQDVPAPAPDLGVTVAVTTENLAELCAPYELAEQDGQVSATPGEKRDDSPAAW